MLNRYLKDYLGILLLTVVYFCAGKLGLSMASVHRSASAVWPPTGLALAAMLLMGYRVWPAIFVGAFLVNWTTPQPIGASLIIAIGNTLEALLGAVLAERFAGGRRAFAQTANIFRFVGLAAVPSNTLSASIGVAALAMFGLLAPGSQFAVWLTWWMGDFISDLLIAPLLLLWFTPPRPRLQQARAVEGMVMLAAVWVFSGFTFAGGWVHGGREYPLEYLGIPLLLWAAFRFHQRGAITAACVMSAVAIRGTLKGHGPFAVGNPNDSLLLLQSFMGVTTLTMVVLAAVLADRATAEERERAARTEAEAANSAKDQFLAVLSHELRTPLTPVMLTASMLENDPQLPARVREDLHTIHRNVALEARLIDDLLDLTRITRGKMQLDFHVVDIHELIRRAMDICCRESRLTLEVKLEAAEHFVRGDPARIQQVFWNLLNNAMKFTPDGGTVSIHSKNERANIVVEVADTGMGIEPDLLPKLFAAFAQGGRATVQKGSAGLGLGLAISKMLITAHGGDICAHSDGHGRGARFVVQMPTVTQPAPSRAPVASDAAPVGTNSPQGLRILLVEDHESTLAVLGKLLSAMQHQVTPARSVAAAEKALEGGSFDLLISDLGLPDGLGYELMQRAKTRYGIKGIALSGYGMDSDIQRSKQAGFLEHLTKPIDLERLEGAIARAAGPAEG